MRGRLISVLTFLLVGLPLAPAWADDYSEAIKVFQNAGESGRYFKTAHGYAVFPDVGKGGLVVGGAYGSGRVYEKGKHIGDAKMTQVSVGLQLGGQEYSEIIFFEDERALKHFTSGNFEFGADAEVVAITAAAGAQATTTGSSSGASGGKHDATTAGKYSKGMATFTVAKGGLMYAANVEGQKFSYKPH